MCDLESKRYAAIMLALLCGVFGIPPATQAQDRASGSSKIRVPAHARIAENELPNVQFEFACSSGKGGALSLAVVLPAPEAVSGFALQRFEGPDGIGEARPLAVWSILGAKPTTVQGLISGWRGVDGDGFLLASSRDSGKESDLARLSKRFLEAEGEPLRLVVDAPGSGPALDVEVLAGDRRTAIASVLAPCLVVVKKEAF